MTLSPPNRLTFLHSERKHVRSLDNRNLDDSSRDDSSPILFIQLIEGLQCSSACFKVDDDGKIVDAKFKTFGCGSAIASSSLATEWVKGKSLDEAATIKNSDIAKVNQI